MTIMHDEILKNAKLIGNVIPNLNKCSGEVIIVIIEDDIISSPKALESFSKDITCLKNLGINPIIIHDSQKSIERIMKEQGIKSSYLIDRKILDRQTSYSVEMIIGVINKDISASISKQGGYAVGISGKDSNLIEAKRLVDSDDSDTKVKQIAKLNFQGEITKVNPELIIGLEDSEMIPVIAPIGVGKNGETYHLTSDDVALHISKIIGANKLIFLTKLAEGSEPQKIPADQIHKILKSEKFGPVFEGKMKICKEAVAHSIETCHILSSEINHILLLEIFTNEPSGITILKSTISK